MNTLAPHTQPVLRQRDPVRSLPSDQSKAPPMRRFEILYQDIDNCPAERQVIAPASPLFEAAFAAFVRGTIIQTDCGPCSVEDLHPGMRILTREFGALPLMWRGSINLISNAPGIDPDSTRLTRVLSDTFGVGKPAGDLVLGPSAQINRSPDAAFPRLCKARALADGDMIVATTPPAPIQAYHICLERQATVLANGVGVSSYHPDPALRTQLGYHRKKLFLSMFPHLEDLQDFGPALQPNLPPTQAEIYD